MMVGCPTSTLCSVATCSRYAKQSAMCLFHSRYFTTQAPGANTTIKSSPQCAMRSTSSPKVKSPAHRVSRCRFLDGCHSYARNHGLCTRHGGGRKCRIVGCPTSSQTNGLCRIHGGGSRCKLDGCDRFARVKGACSVHAKLHTPPCIALVSDIYS
ncbi:hypothetical protein H257_02181 [Aphanomyces astaci]|uniref:Uncharacterized protein n=1 Tax=Aphanomyces astaci TaxID=112090 RepID=W4H5M6_APHAT|nr:hypothetical protein H257_02181 [Aphanomyces astaci]ETV87212.1 hypothetical protein H257_02181 [Aphanomyces astaci]|eukprot:XP_009824011.1 hypothetical protein H257_02181 [Aphanomyces astaci]